jgi:endonuclease/exonuclease/phosphatase family metal-dependent hydrolase
MNGNKTNITRRNFMKGAAVVAATPFIAPLTNIEGNIVSQRSGLHHILSCNIRVALPEDEKAGVGWLQRKEACIKVIKSEKPDIICLQEVLRAQNEDIKAAFPKYFSFGFEGPEMDLFKEGYHGIAKNPIFFSTERYELLAAGQYWLSESPLIGGSLSWETARARQANWVRLRDRKTKLDFRITNLHLDHISQSARERQIKLVLQETAQYNSTYPQILSGDFNVGGANTVYNAILEGGWADTYTNLHGSAEPGYTAHQFLGEKYIPKGDGKKIDFIFMKGSGKATSSEIIKDKVGGRYPSDHYFLSASIAFG